MAWFFRCSAEEVAKKRLDVQMSIEKVLAHAKLEERDVYHDYFDTIFVKNVERKQYSGGWGDYSYYAYEITFLNVKTRKEYILGDIRSNGNHSYVIQKLKNMIVDSGIRLSMLDKLRDEYDSELLKVMNGLEEIHVRRYKPDRIGVDILKFRFKPTDKLEEVEQYIYNKLDEVIANEAREISLLQGKMESSPQ